MESKQDSPFTNRNTSSRRHRATPFGLCRRRAPCPSVADRKSTTLVWSTRGVQICKSISPRVTPERSVWSVCTMEQWVRQIDLSLTRSVNIPLPANLPHFRLHFPQALPQSPHLLRHRCHLFHPLLPRRRRHQSHSGFLQWMATIALTPAARIAYFARPRPKPMQSCGPLRPKPACKKPSTLPRNRYHLRSKPSMEAIAHRILQVQSPPIRL